MIRKPRLKDAVSVRRSILKEAYPSAAIGVDKSCMRRPGIQYASPL